MISGPGLRVKIVSRDVDGISSRLRVLVHELLRKGIHVQLLVGDVGPTLGVPENRIFDREASRYREVQSDLLIALKVFQMKKYCLLFPGGRW